MLDVRHIKTSGINEFAHNDVVETVVIMPSLHPHTARKTAGLLAGRTRKNGLLIIAEDDCRLGFIATANFVHAKTRSRYVAYVAQDSFAGFFWLDRAIQTMEQTGAGLLAFCDGIFFGEIAGFGLARREWTDTVYGNLLFYPQYAKHYGDVELTDIARQTGKLAYNPSSVMIEVDYQRLLPEGEEEETPDTVLYVKRALHGFDKRVRPFMPRFGTVSSLAKMMRENPFPQADRPKADEQENGPRIFNS